MSKDAFALSDVREPTLTIACDSCGRRGLYAVSRPMGRDAGVREIRRDTREPAGISDSVVPDICLTADKKAA